MPAPLDPGYAVGRRGGSLPGACAPARPPPASGGRVLIRGGAAGSSGRRGPPPAAGWPAASGRRTQTTALPGADALSRLGSIVVALRPRRSSSAPPRMAECGQGPRSVRRDGPGPHRGGGFPARDDPVSTPSSPPKLGQDWDLGAESAARDEGRPFVVSEPPARGPSRPPRTRFGSPHFQVFEKPRHPRHDLKETLEIPGRNG